ncbi:MAG: hypothetical protein AB9903_25020 [Vulcanimicrobiota bacterium]
MTTNLERYKTDLAKLVDCCDKMLLDLTIQGRRKTKTLDKKYHEVAKKIEGSFENNYQKWYTEACAVIRQLIPDRLQEFTYLYQGDGRRKKIDITTYHIQDWLIGVRSGNSFSGEKLYDDSAIVYMRFNTQAEIFKSAESRFESSLFDIAQLVRADLFDSELDAARELTKNGFLRGAGAIVGVVIEKHLLQVCTNHLITIRKQHPTICDFNDLLKNGTVIDVPQWRQIQRLGDIRNLCDHGKQREPTKEEVSELIDGADRLCKTLF